MPLRRDVFSKGRGLLRVAISVTTLLASFTCALGQALSESADKFTEALVYARFSDQAWQCQDSVATVDPMGTAEKWVRQAIKAASEFKSADRARRVRAKEFLGVQRVALGRIKEWRKFAKEGPAKVDALLSGANLPAAEKLLPAGEPPVCDLRIHAAFEKVVSSRAKYQDLVTAGKRLAASAQPMAALERYHAAQRIDFRNKELERLIRQVSF